MSSHKNKRNVGDQAPGLNIKEKLRKSGTRNLRATNFKRAERIVGVAGSILSIITFFRGSYTLALWLLVAVIIAVSYFRIGITKISVVLAITVFVVAFVVQQYVLIPMRAPFSIGIETAFVAETRDASGFAGEFGGHFASPIPVMLFLQIVNLQDLPSTVSDFRVQAESGSNWWGLRKRWLDMPHLPDGMPLLLMNRPPLLPQRVEMVGPLLNPILESRPLQPHEGVTGWIFLDAPAEYDYAHRPLKFRIIVTDSVGRSISVFPQVHDLGNMVPQRGLRIEPPVEIPNLVIRHFFDPYPN